MNKSNRTISIVLLFGMLFASSFLALNMNVIVSPEVQAESLMLDEDIIDEEINDEQFEEPVPTWEDSNIVWRPIEESLSIAKGSVETGLDDTKTVVYDPLTKSEMTIEKDQEISSELTLETSVIEEYRGLFTPESGMEAVIGTDGRSRITPTTSFPYRTVVKLYITAADSSTWVGSGAILDGFHILTAGHCVYIHDHGGWVSSIEVVPAKDTGVADEDPYGHAWMTYMRSYTGWTSSEMVEHDWAVVTLDRNVGVYTGWMGRITASSSSSIYSEYMNVAGYPTDLDGGENMYFDSDIGDGATEYNHYYMADTAGGMSGGPVWRYVDGNRYIMTVHAYGRGGVLSNRSRLFQLDSQVVWKALLPLRSKRFMVEQSIPV